MVLRGLLLFVLLMVSGCCLGPPDSPAYVPGTAPRHVRIVLAGDSTVNSDAGWGPGLASLLTADAECVNLALNGRWSKSFIVEGQWAKCLAAKPDYVFIQFGHNDQPGKGPDRETIPQTTYKQYLTTYIDEARASGAKPVLITSLGRRAWGNDGKIQSTLTPWADAVKELGRAKNVPVIDLHAISIALYEKVGRAECNSMSPTATNGTIDNTHLNAKGAQVIGGIVARELKTTVPELAGYIK